MDEPLTYQTWDVRQALLDHFDTGTRRLLWPECFQLFKCIYLTTRHPSKQASRAASTFRQIVRGSTGSTTLRRRLWSSPRTPRCSSATTRQKLRGRSARTTANNSFPPSRPVLLRGPAPLPHRPSSMPPNVPAARGARTPRPALARRAAALAPLPHLRPERSSASLASWMARSRKQASQRLLRWRAAASRGCRSTRRLLGQLQRGEERLQEGVQGGQRRARSAGAAREGLQAHRAGCSSRAA